MEHVLRSGMMTVLVAVILFPPPAAGRAFLGIGSGVKHTNGAALQVAVPVYRHVELHYSAWHHAHSDQAAGIGYRFEDGGPLSVVLGFAYVGRVTENLLRHEDAYIEVRYDFTEGFSCQISHYSTIGDDKGENLLLCGVRWDWPHEPPSSRDRH